MSVKEDVRPQAKEAGISIGDVYISEISKDGKKKVVAAMSSNGEWVDVPQDQKLETED